MSFFLSCVDEKDVALKSRAAHRAANQTGAQRSGSDLERRSRMTELPPTGLLAGGAGAPYKVFASDEKVVSRIGPVDKDKI